MRSCLRPCAAAVLVGALGLTLLTACGGEERAPLGPGATELGAGTHTIDLVALVPEGRGNALMQLPQIEVTVPEGWESLDGWAIHKGRVETARVAVAFWDVDKVYATPCKWSSTPMIDPGRGVSSLADVLAERPLRNATSPREMTLDGFRGKYLEWSVPTDIAFDEARRADAIFPECDEQTFQSWTSRGWNSDRYQQAPGQVDRIWILDVNGERLVIDAFHHADATTADRAELDAVVRSIRFVDSASR